MVLARCPVLEIHRHLSEIWRIGASLIVRAGPRAIASVRLVRHTVVGGKKIRAGVEDVSLRRCSSGGGWVGGGGPFHGSVAISGGIAIARSREFKFAGCENACDKSTARISQRSWRASAHVTFTQHLFAACDDTNAVVLMDTASPRAHNLPF